MLSHSVSSLSSDAIKKKKRIDVLSRSPKPMDQASRRTKVLSDRNLIVEEPELPPTLDSLFTDPKQSRVSNQDKSWTTDLDSGQENRKTQVSLTIADHIKSFSECKTMLGNQNVPCSKLVESGQGDLIPSPLEKQFAALNLVSLTPEGNMKSLTDNKPLKGKATASFPSKEQQTVGKRYKKEKDNEQSEDKGVQKTMVFSENYEELWDICGGRPILFSKPTQQSIAKLYFVTSNQTYYLASESWRDCFMVGSTLSGWLLFIKPNGREVFFQHVGSGNIIELAPLPNYACPSHTQLLGGWKGDVVGEPGDRDLVIMLMAYSRPNFYSQEVKLVVLQYLRGSWTGALHVSKYNPITCGPLTFLDDFMKPTVVWMETGAHVRYLRESIFSSVSRPVEVPTYNRKTSMIWEKDRTSILFVEGTLRTARWARMDLADLYAGNPSVEHRPKLNSDMYLIEGEKGCFWGKQPDVSRLDIYFAERLPTHHLSFSYIRNRYPVYFLSADSCNEPCVCSLAWII